MGKPTGKAVAARAVQAVAEGHTYAELDCQALVEFCVAQCGGVMAYAGSNDMARNAVTELWTLAEAKAGEKLVPGAGLFIRESSGGEPAKYKADGLGNFSHVGFFVGERALTDTDKNGKSRVCNCVHSSATMGRVAGSTLQNGWTHAGWFSAIDVTSQTGAVAACETGSAALPADGTGSARDGAAVATAAAVDTSGFYAVKRGCKGGAVRRLQTWLAQLGYGLGDYGVDGVFGAATEAAVRCFQAAKGLDADGWVGRQTWAALAAARQAAAAEADAAIEADATTDTDTATVADAATETDAAADEPGDTGR